MQSSFSNLVTEGKRLNTTEIELIWIERASKKIFQIQEGEFIQCVKENGKSLEHYFSMDLVSSLLCRISSDYRKPKQFYMIY